MKYHDPEFQPTDEDLVRTITDNALASGFTAEETRGILLAERANGLLRKNCPAWLRRTQYFLAQHGKLYPAELVAKASADWLRELERLELDAEPLASAAHRGARD